MMNTPWGRAQTVTERAQGITEVTTAGHGGILLSPGRVVQMPEALRRHETSAGGDRETGGRWYEEDIDWAFVALAFPQSFSAYEVRCAWRTLARSENLSPILDHLRATDPAHYDYLRRVAEAWDRENADRWTRGSCGTAPNGDGWLVQFRRVGDGETVWRRLSSSEFYELAGPTLAELPGEPVGQKWGAANA